MAHLWISMNPRGYLEIHTGTAREATDAENRILCVPTTMDNAEAWIATLSGIIGRLATIHRDADADNGSVHNLLDRASAASTEDFPTTPDTIELFIGQLIERHYQNGYLMFLRQLLAKWCEVYCTAMQEV